MNPHQSIIFFLTNCYVINSTNSFDSFLSQKKQNCSIFPFFEGNSYEINLDPQYHYYIALWGASGGGSSFSTYPGAPPGFGGFVGGFLKNLKQPLPAYVYVGGKGQTVDGVNQGKGGYNGGVLGGKDVGNDCNSGGSGGGTDIRLFPTTVGLTQSLGSRLMVAGGGGSSGCVPYGFGDGVPGCCMGGNGGNVNGGNGANGNILHNNHPGGKGGSSDLFDLNYFGFGQIGETALLGGEAGGSGGGGYFGGFHGIANDIAGAGGASGGGGGSSYISGYSNCKTVTQSGQLADTEIHESGYVFESGEMIQGNQTMSYPNKISKIGNEGDGLAIIVKYKDSTHYFSNKRKLFTLRNLLLGYLLFMSSHCYPVN